MARPASAPVRTFRRKSSSDDRHRMVAVGYRGSAPALNDLVAGSIDVMFDNITSSISLVRGGRIRALGVTSRNERPWHRFPTIAETVPGYDVSTFFGVVVRAGTPPESLRGSRLPWSRSAKEPSVRERLAGVAPKPSAPARTISRSSWRRSAAAGADHHGTRYPDRVGETERGVLGPSMDIRFDEVIRHSRGCGSSASSRAPGPREDHRSHR